MSVLGWHLDSKLRPQVSTECIDCQPLTLVSGQAADMANTPVEQRLQLWLICEKWMFWFITNICGHSFTVVLFFVSALELLKNAIAKAGYTDKIVIGMDVAASEFYKDGKYDLDFKSPDDPSRYISPDKLADLYRSFVKDYPGRFLTHARWFMAAAPHSDRF